MGLFDALFGARPAPPPHGVVAVWPTSGGPGASTVASSLAAVYAGGADTILVDCDQTRGTLESLLNPLPGPALGAAVARRPHDDEPLPEGMLYPVRWGARFLPGLVGPAAPVAVDPGGLSALLDRLRRECDILVLDLGEELPHDLEAAARAVRAPVTPVARPAPPPPLSAYERSGGAGHAAALWLADVVVVVARDTPQGRVDLRGEYPLLHRVLSRASRPPLVGVAVNHLATGHIDGWAQALKKEGLPFWGHVPYDGVAVGRSWGRSAPLTFADPHSKAAKALVALAGVVEGALVRRGSSEGAVEERASDRARHGRPRAG